MRLFICAIFLFIASCGPKKSLIMNTRDADFYNRFVNSSAENTATVESKLATLKLLQTDKVYPMRIALFDNETFYYQVDKLGKGTGRWSYQDGALQMRATRPFFDLEIYLSALKVEGDEIVFQFLDRFGLNTVPASLREPAAANMPLEEFTSSLKGL
jgi:hypothetical protein